MSLGPAQNLLSEVIAYERAIAPDVADISKRNSAHIEIMQALRQNFRNITGADLVEPAEIWKYQYIFNAVKNELPVAINKTKSGDKNAAKYVAGFLTLLGELNFNLSQYVKQQQNPNPPTGTPFDPVPFDVITPPNVVAPGNPVIGPPAPPTKKTMNPLLLIGGGLVVAKLFKII